MLLRCFKKSKVISLGYIDSFIDIDFKQLLFLDSRLIFWNTTKMANFREMAVVMKASFESNSSGNLGIFKGKHLW